MHVCNQNVVRLWILFFCDFQCVMEIYSLIGVRKNLLLMYDYAFQIISSVNRYKTNTKNSSNSQALTQLYIKMSIFNFKYFENSLFCVWWNIEYLVAMAVVAIITKLLSRFLHANEIVIKPCSNTKWNRWIKLFLKIINPSAYNIYHLRQCLCKTFLIKTIFHHAYYLQ